ncbi:hypothetical protein A1Q2_04850 [Trichosporon asahii var. asahii CBS 8904]|uniref:UBC core domain-containing protein n=2 Tax=Trichosporon asahii var. asahii TaxID=189963 RepID=K1VA14_TRIAC|nr:hypothetical protein A1Q1_01825 [Trichosporon asahii var. asahii CBS 2479]EJT52785.1 hypothetical protein A1Q1_01825 [Trichosporon asahii var. asahii CBS 2479]EKD00840.1 hypothetical protein A1Q2_04850 [Trichosporon asahii var. asahii CBS 8904]
MASKVAQKRLQKEYMSMQKSPPPFIWAVPEEKNILDSYSGLRVKLIHQRGPPDSPYAGGEYHGLIWFPPDYREFWWSFILTDGPAFKPPDVKMFTPSGRFEPGVKICMSMTSYTWNAAWSVATILTGLLSFMLSDEITAGAVKTTDEQKRQLAAQSHGFNLNNRKFRYATPQMTDLPDMGQPGSSPSEVSKPKQAAFSPTPPSLSASSTPTIPDSTPATPALPGANGVAVAPAAGPVQQQRQWFPSWRWLVAIVVLAVLGRLSKQS